LGQLHFKGLPLFNPLFKIKKCGWQYFLPFECVEICNRCIAFPLKILLVAQRTFLKERRKKTVKKKKKESRIEGGEG
jgi:hypothetical protein